MSGSPSVKLTCLWYFTLNNICLFCTLVVFLFKGNASGVLGQGGFLGSVGVFVRCVVPRVFVPEFVFVFAVLLCGARLVQRRTLGSGRK